MNQKNKVTVKIMDRDYTLVSDDSREHMQKVANFVDDKMQETYACNRKLSTSMIGVLTALNIADELHKVRAEKDELEKRINSPQYELKSARDELDAVASEFERRSMAYEKIVTEISKLIDSSSVYETGISQLKRRMEKLDQDLKRKEKDLTSAKKESLEQGKDSNRPIHFEEESNE